MLVPNDSWLTFVINEESPLNIVPPKRNIEHCTISDENDMQMDEEL